MRIFDTHAESTARAFERFVDIVGGIVVATTTSTMLVDHDPLFKAEVNGVLDGQVAQNVFINMDYLILFKNHRSGQHCLVGQVEGVALNRQLPVPETLRLHQQRDAILYLRHLLVRLEPAHGEAVTHTRACPDLLRYAIDAAEFWRQMDVLISMLYDNERLFEVSHILLVHVVHVLGYAGLLAVVVKLLLRRIGLKVYPINDVGALVAPICDDRRAYNLSVDPVHKVGIVACLAPQLVDLVEAGNRRHEAGQCVDANCEASLGHEYRGLVATEHLKLHRG